MRNRLIAAAAAALAGAATLPGVAATAAPTEQTGAAPPDTAAVALPTGETLIAAGDGTYTPLADGVFLTTRNTAGDRIILPADATDELAAGSYDLEDFNVDALANGTPARAAEDTAASARAVEAAFTARWLDGGVPDQYLIEVVGTATGERHYVDLDEHGEGALRLEPGRYHLVAVLLEETEAGTPAIAAVQEFKVRGNGADVVIDGTRAAPLGFDLDREAEVQGGSLDVFSYAPGTEDGAYAGLLLDESTPLYAIPSGRITGDRPAGFVFRQGLASPEGTDDPYSYSLFRAETDGIPRDLTLTVRDESLARIDAAYQSLGAATVLNRQDLSDHPEFEAAFYTFTGPVPLPSTRTEFFTADADLTWSHLGYFPTDGRPGDPWDLVHHRSGVLEPGSVGEAVWNNAPLSVGIDNVGQDWPPATFVRWDELEALYFAPWMFSSASGGEGIQSEYLPGTITLARDGEILAQNTEIGLAVGLSDVEAGRLTLSAVADREAAWTPLGTRSAAEWSFAYDPEGNPVLPVSVVEFAASGIMNGYAEAGAVQDVELEFAQQPGADDQACAAMTFAVSYDDGETWTEVPIDREGDTATARIESPEDAAFVSVRFTAADEAGNTVEHETIRSYGLK
jgi:hypothetical protein